jgi:hypothetical protein
VNIIVFLSVYRVYSVSIDNILMWINRVVHYMKMTVCVVCVRWR